MAESSVFTRKDKTKSKLTLKCENCSKVVRRKSKFSCKCSLYVYCSEHCRSKHLHYAGCKGGDGTVEKMDSLSKLVIESDLRISLAEELKREVDAGLLTIEWNTFKELKAKETNPTACWRVAVALMNNTGKEKKHPYFCALPSKYSEMTYFQRHDLALEWLKKASELGHPLAMSSLGKLTLHLRTIFNIDGRKGMDWLAKALQRGDSNSETEFEKHSVLVKGIQGIIFKLLEDKKNKMLYLNQRMYLTPDLGGILLARCLAHLKNNDWEEAADFGKIWGLKQMQMFDQIVGNLAPLEVHIVPIFSQQAGYTFTRNKHTVRYTMCPNYSATGANKDWDRVCKGLESVDNADHIKYGCSHIDNTYAPPATTCRLCFYESVKRVKAVSEGAYAISKDVIGEDEEGASGLHWYGVVYQGEKCIKESFVGYSKEEIKTVLNLLSMHTADIDPRVVCLNPDLYWSVVWFYGSVYTALETIGGKKLQQKAFFTHKKQKQPKLSKDESVDPFIESACPQLAKVHSLNKGLAVYDPSPCPGISEFENLNYKDNYDLPVDHILTELMSSSGDWRYVCGNEECFKFETTPLFLKCTGCKDSAKRRYCSEMCQRADWSKHKIECDWKKK